MTVRRLHSENLPPLPGSPGADRPPRGGFRFLRGLAPYSGGAIVAAGFEIEHAPLPPSAGPPTFVLAGAGELPEGSLEPERVVRRGETSPEAIEEKARFVLGIFNARLRELGAAWRDATAINVYTVHDIHPLLGRFLLEGTAGAPHGVTWHYARPPIMTIEFELDVRACRREIVLHT